MLYVYICYLYTMDIHNGYIQWIGSTVKAWKLNEIINVELHRQEETRKPWSSSLWEIREEENPKAAWENRQVKKEKRAVLRRRAGQRGHWWPCSVAFGGSETFVGMNWKGKSHWISPVEKSSRGLEFGPSSQVRWLTAICNSKRGGGEGNVNGRTGCVTQW